MKKTIFLYVIFLAYAIGSFANPVEVGGIYYYLYASSGGGTAQVTHPQNGSHYSREVVSIPSKITYDNRSYPVTSIGSEAFRGCSELTRITIPNSVTSIGSSAFYNCTRLTSVTIPNSVTSIGKDAFYNCTRLTSVTIPNSVTSIGKDAFWNCNQGLTSIVVAEDNPTFDSRNNCNCIIETSSNTLIVGCNNSVIPNSVTSIGKDAFYNCYIMTEITIPNSVTSIGEKAFYACSGLSSVTIPNSVKSIGSKAFSNSGLLSVTIGNSVTTIESCAFYGCTGLTSVTIPNSVTNIGEQAFACCSGLTEITIPNSVKNIGEQAFAESRLTSVAIPNSVTSIGDEAFYRCYYLHSVAIPNSVTTIKSGAFHSCTSLTSVTIPNSVKSIGEKAFSESGLTSVAIPNSVTSIGDEAFSYSGLTSVTIPNSVTKIEYGTFYGCSGLTSITIPNSVTSIGNYAFYGCSSLLSVTIPNSVTSIGGMAFYNCVKLERVNISDIKSWCGIAFKYISLPNSDDYPPRYMYTSNPLFYAHHLYLNGEEIKDLIIPNSVTSIEKYAFYGCSSLSSVTIPNSVRSIGNEAFYGCDQLQRVNISDIKSWCGIAFGGYSNPLYYAHHLYLNGEEIKDLIIPNSVTRIEDYAFCDCSGLTAVFIPGSVTSIGSGAFNINNLKTIAIESITPPSLLRTFSSSSYSAVLYVPIGFKFTYAEADEWKNFKNIVESDYITGVSLSPASMTFSALNATQALTATFTPSNAAYNTLTWTSSDETVATVDENGVVTSKNYGTATITATTTDGSNKSAACSVTVFTPILVTGVSLNKTSLNFSTLNATQTLTATVSPDNATNKNLEWTSSNTNVATISNSGVVTAKGNGTATITATTTDGSNKSATCTVTVSTPILVTGVSLKITSLSFSALNTTQTLTAIVTPSNAANKTLTWTSSNTNVATVTSNGVVTSKGNGTATITAKATDGSNKSATCSVTVSTPIPATGVFLNKTSLTFSALNTTQTLTATVTPSNADNKTLTWTSSNTNVATVSSSGVITSKGNGTATITATTTDGSNKSAKCTVTVSAPTLVSSISLNNTSLFFSAPNSTQTLTATVTPSNAANKNLEWTSSNNSVATVSSSGVVTSKGNGTATITARATDGSNTSATCIVTVGIPVVGISLSNTSLTFSAIDSKETLTATVTPSNAANKNLEWTSSNPDVATVTSLISSRGVVTAKGSGTATITARAKDGSNISATCTVTVTIPVDGISLSNTSLTFTALNTTQTLTATVTPSSAANKKLTWTSSNTNVATVNSNGVVTSKGNGTATITATTTDGSNKNATCSVIVSAPILVTGVSLNKTSLTFSALNTTQTLTATVTPSNAANKILNWTSSNTDVATVNIYGVVTSKGYGTATITATANDGSNKSATCSVTVSKPKYTLKFVADGKVVSETSVEYGSAITAPKAPAKTGYTFVSWGNVAATMPAKDVTYTAQYKVNQYKLTYLIDGRVYKTYTLDYNSVINPEGEAEDDDYYYGWEEVPNRMPDHDVTVNAYITGIAAAGKGITNGKYEIYTIDGKKLNNLQKGVNIIRFVNGITKKLVK